MYYHRSDTDSVIKLTLTKGENEHAFVAAGVHYRGGWYQKHKITGNWSPPSEDGKIPVEFKIEYTMGTTYVELKGVFDPEENSLRGTAEESYLGGVECAPIFQAKGVFVFKRDPELVRFYPNPSVTNARKRWEFALTLVRDRVRRQAWSSKQISQRIRDRRRFMELTLKHHHGKRWTDDERAEYVAILPRFYAADAEFCASIIIIKMSKVVVYV